MADFRSPAPAPEAVTAWQPLLECSRTFWAWAGTETTERSVTTRQVTSGKLSKLLLRAGRLESPSLAENAYPSAPCMSGWRGRLPLGGALRKITQTSATDIRAEEQHVGREKRDLVASSGSVRTCLRASDYLAHFTSVQFLSEHFEWCVTVCVRICATLPFRSRLTLFRKSVTELLLSQNLVCAHLTHVKSVLEVLLKLERVTEAHTAPAVKLRFAFSSVLLSLGQSWLQSAFGFQQLHVTHDGRSSHPPAHNEGGKVCARTDVIQFDCELALPFLISVL